ncbi:MAG: hypothetical protein BWY06_02365 [Candidatus Latescibacteria bacterium ADurb.Bin168]|nr:MAG: hypothetical protein BWY06_02365 [Candidatus Latescibacteria bacterium ADurb.Bin168]
MGLVSPPPNVTLPPSSRGTTTSNESTPMSWSPRRWNSLRTYSNVFRSPGYPTARDSPVTIAAMWRARLSLVTASITAWLSASTRPKSTRVARWGFKSSPNNQTDTFSGSNTVTARSCATANTIRSHLPILPSNRHKEEFTPFPSAGTSPDVWGTSAIGISVRYSQNVESFCSRSCGNFPGVDSGLESVVYGAAGNTCRFSSGA